MWLMTNTRALYDQGVQCLMINMDAHILQPMWPMLNA
jgi:hypothetical protein